MGKVLYYTACTLDGFIADEAHSLDWLVEVPSSGDGSAWETFIGPVGALAMGATTYTWVVEHEALLDHPERWTEWYGDRPCWVFSHRDLPRIPGVDVRLVEGDVRPVHAEMDATGGDSWIVGGGDLVGQFDDAGLLDEIHLGMCPVTLGAGAPLLPRRITSERLTLRSVEKDGQRARLVLDVAR